MIRYLLNRAKSNRADGVLVFGIFGILFLSLVCGFGIDIAKNAYIKQNYVTQTQNATNTALKTIDSRGSLTVGSVSKFVSEYMVQSGRKSRGPLTPDTATAENNVFRMGCTTALVSGTEYPGPYMRITLGTARQAGTNGVVFTSIAGAAPVQTAGTINPTTVYNVISAEVYDVSDNVMLSWFGIPCQHYQSSVSSISFGSNDDIP